MSAWKRTRGIEERSARGHSTSGVPGSWSSFWKRCGASRTKKGGGEGSSGSVEMTAEGTCCIMKKLPAPGTSVNEGC